MIVIPLSDNETARLEALQRYNILDTLPEPAFDDLTRLAAHICRTPVALISFVDSDRQWFKSAFGIDITETPIDTAICSHTIQQYELLIVPDALQDVRTVGLPVVANEPHVRFYAGIALTTSDGQALGTLCVIDFVPRQLDETQTEALRALARQVMIQLELRLALREGERMQQTLRERDARLQLITDAAPVLISYVDTEQRYQFNNRAYEEWFSRRREDVQGRPVREMLGEVAYNKVQPKIEAALRGERIEYEANIPRHTDGMRHVSAAYVPDVDESGQVRGFVALINDITARKNAERQLEESEQHYRSLFEYNPDAVYSLDLQGRFLTANPACRTLTGYTQDELLQMSCMAIVAPADIEKAKHYFHLAARGESQNYEVGTLHKEGHRVEVNITTLPIVVAGHITGVFGVVKDITERKRAEADLRAANVQIAGILESITDAFAAFDREWRYTYVNRRAAQMLGKSVEELIGQTVWDLFPNAVGTPFERELRRAVAERVKVRFEYESPVVGEWIEIHAYPSPDGVSIYFQSIAERKMAEQARDNQQQWLQEALNLAPVPILFIEPGTARVTFANRAANELAGGEFPREKTAEEYHTAYFCTDENGRRIPDERMPGVRVARGERLENFQMDWHTASGKRSLLIFADALPAMHGQPETGIVVFQDVSVLKKIEAQLRAASRLKDEFLATVSHELRTPLTAIIGWAHLLRAGGLDEATTARALNTIERNGRAQSQLIEDLLDVSRIISGKLRLDVRRVEPSLIVESAVESIRPATEAKGVRLQVIIDPKAGPVYGDSDRLQQVVWNLLSNAVKFTPRGGRVQIRLQRINSHIEIVVSDTGQGIDPDFLPHVFDRFRQADQASTRAHGGLGLGLSIVHHLVQLHGGGIEVDSDGPGCGATFTVRLPTMIVNVESSVTERREHPTTGDAPPADAGFRLDGVRVLVVDDEPDTTELLALVLRRRGAQVTTAPSTREALKLFDQQPPDVLISDIGMPEEDGYTLISRVRARSDERGGRVPAVALTAYARVEDRVRGLAAGFQVHVPKPVQPVEIIAVVASLTGRTGNTEPI